MSVESEPLDGNAAAGLLQQAFAFEATAAVFTCDGCGAAGELGAAQLYGGAMGAVLRCAKCGGVVLRVSQTPRGLWLDMRGARGLVVRSAGA
ncbi:MAG: DUF6510 family protein [Pseudomonadota bacterium]